MKAKFNQKELFEQGLHGCTKCGEVKHFVDFSSNKSRKYGISAFCKSCINELEKIRYYKDNSSRKRAIKKWNNNNRNHHTVRLSNSKLKPSEYFEQCNSSRKDFIKYLVQSTSSPITNEINIKRRNPLKPFKESYSLNINSQNSVCIECGKTLPIIMFKAGKYGQKNGVSYICNFCTDSKYIKNKIIKQTGIMKNDLPDYQNLIESEHLMLMINRELKNIL